MKNSESSNMVKELDEEKELDSQNKADAYFDSSEKFDNLYFRFQIQNNDKYF